MEQVDLAETASLLASSCAIEVERNLCGSQEFIADYYQGTMAFIDDNWRMIHRAAGWAALRTFLLVSVRVISGRGWLVADSFQDVYCEQVPDGFGGRSNTATLRMFNQVELRVYKRELMFNKTSALHFKLNI
jgi:hypothetical protein